MTWFKKQWRQGSDTCESLVNLFSKMLGKKIKFAEGEKSIYQCNKIVKAKLFQEATFFIIIFTYPK